MDKQQIINYVMDSPENTNPAILNQMIDEVGGSGNNEEKYPVVWTDGTAGAGIIHIEYFDENDIIPILEFPSNDDIVNWSYPYIYGKDDDDLSVRAFMSNYPNGICIVGMRQQGD